MVRRVLEERESAFVLRVRNDLETALATSKKQRVAPDKLQRLERLLSTRTKATSARSLGFDHRWPQSGRQKTAERQHVHEPIEAQNSYSP